MAKRQIIIHKGGGVLSLYGFVKKAFKYPILLLYRVKIVGKENEPDLPYIICANHSSFMDPVLITVAVKAKPIWIGKKELLKYSFLRWVFKKTGSIAINREGFDTSALRQCISVVKEGNCLGIFPQGTRLRGIKPEPDQAHAGLAFIAGMAKATVLPVSIVSKRLQPKILRKTKIIFHNPVTYEEYMGIAENPTKQEIAGYLFGKVCEPFNGENGKKSK